MSIFVLKLLNILEDNLSLNTIFKFDMLRRAYILNFRFYSFVFVEYLTSLVLPIKFVNKTCLSVSCLVRTACHPRHDVATYTRYGRVWKQRRGKH
jgi:hypothetical protein